MKHRRESKSAEAERIDSSPDLPERRFDNEYFCIEQVCRHNDLAACMFVRK